MLPWALASALGITLSRYQFNRLGPKPLLLLGMSAQALGIALLMHVQNTELLLPMALYALMGFGGSLSSSTAQNTAFIDLASAPLEAINQQLQNFLAAFENSRRQELLALVKKVSEQVIRCELTLNPTQLLTLAEEALSAMPLEAVNVHINLHPQEFARIKDLVPERAASWRLVANETLALGECRIVTPQAEVDVGCQQRLDACVTTLSEHMNLSEE